MKVNIIDLDHKGNGIAKIDNKIIFIPKSIPGDYIDIDIIKDKKKYSEGIIKEIINSSEDRIESLCPYYSICGGCNISNINYKKQLEYKKNKVINIFKRYLNLNINPEILGSDIRYEYRNKITYKLENNNIGLISLNNKLINIDNCYLVSNKVNNLYKELKKEELSSVNKIIIKECDNGLLLEIDGNMNINNISNLCLSIYQNKECIYYKEDGYININNLKYKISMNSFFQVNTSNIPKLYNTILEYGNFTSNDKVIDLYCGVGSISLYISNYVKSVLGIEIIEDAIKDAKENAKINHITNCNFICGDVSKLIDDNINGNIVIVDPPRIGLDEHTIDILNKITIDKLIYVSCDPMTLVRDIKRLHQYQLIDITLVDMFPQTHHVECVSLLHRKKLEK